MYYLIEFKDMFSRSGRIVKAFLSYWQAAAYSNSIDSDSYYNISFIEVDNDNINL